MKGSHWYEQKVTLVYYHASKPNGTFRGKKLGDILHCEGAMSHKAIYRQPLLGISMKKSHLHLNANIFIFGLTCATKVVLQQALQLVASKLPVKVAPCDKALKLH